MKKILLSRCAFFFILLLAGCELNDCDLDGKVNVCHKGKVISISSHALPAHKAHGDAIDMDHDGYFGGENSCSVPDCDDTNPDINPGADDPNDCTADLCSITNLEVLNAT